jgi:hypothetical protein
MLGAIARSNIGMPFSGNIGFGDTAMNPPKEYGFIFKG